jgi:hypothetical protein
MHPVYITNHADLNYETKSELQIIELKERITEQ